MADDAAKRYLVVIQLAPQTTSADLIRRVPSLKDHVSNFSGGEMEQFFRSADSQTFGWFFRSSKPLPVMRSILDNATTNAEAVMILELGSNVDAKGFGRAATWLQHH